MCLFFYCCLNETIFCSTCQLCDLVCYAQKIFVLASLEKGLETNWLLRGISLNVFLLIIDVLKLMDKLGGGSFAKSFLLFLALNNETLFFKLPIFFFVLMCFRLAIKELHQRHMVNHCIRVVDQYELFLAIVQHFVSSFSRDMHEKEFGWLPLPRGWILRILSLINFNRFVTLFQFFPPLSSPCLRIILVWIVFLDHWRTVVLLFHRLISGFNSSFYKERSLLLKTWVNCFCSRGRAIRIFRHILTLGQIKTACNLVDLARYFFGLFLLFLLFSVLGNLSFFFCFLFFLLLFCDLLLGFWSAPNFRGFLILVSI